MAGITRKITVIGASANESALAVRESSSGIVLLGTCTYIQVILWMSGSELWKRG